MNRFGHIIENLWSYTPKMNETLKAIQLYGFRVAEPYLLLMWS